MKIGEVLEEYEKVHIPKDDYLVPSNEISMDKDGTIVFEGDASNYHLTDHAMTQLVRKVRTLAGLSASVMTTRYLKACPSHSRAFQINDWISNYDDDKKWMFRVEQNGGRIKAVLSDNYSKLDNMDLLNIVKDTHNGIEFNDVWMNTDTLHLRYTNPATRKGSGKLATVAGWHTTNSEIGTRSVSVGFLIYQLICTNGLMGLRPQDIYRKRHVGDMDIKYDFAAALENFDVAAAKEEVDKVINTEEMIIEEPTWDVYKAVQQNFPALNKSVIELAKEKIDNYDDEHKGFTKFGLISSLTESIRDLHSADARYDAEKVVGKLFNQNSLELQDGDESKIIRIGA